MMPTEPRQYDIDDNKGRDDDAYNTFDVEKNIENDEKDEERENIDDAERSHEDDSDIDEDSVSSDLAHLTLESEDGEMTLERMVNLIKRNSCQKIIVLSGAGVSVAAGIPVSKIIFR